MLPVTIYVVYSITWIKIIIRSNRRSNVRYAYWPPKILCVVKYFKLIEMCMAEELGCYRTFVPVDQYFFFN